MSGYVGILGDDLRALHGELVDDSRYGLLIPGIGVELKTTTSRGVMETFLCMEDAILERAVSHHLKQLKSAGLIVSRRDGQEVYYRAADTEPAQNFHHMIEWLVKIACPAQIETQKGMP